MKQSTQSLAPPFYKRLMTHVKWRILKHYRVEFPSEEKRIRDFTAYLWRKRWGGSNFCRFVVATEPRSGSNLLMSLLDSHDEIYVRGEMMSMSGRGNIRGRLDSLYQKQPHGIKAAGFKTFYDHPYNGNIPDYWDALAEIDGLKLIYLFRRNKLAQLVSIRRAAATDQWAQTGSPTTGESIAPITVTPDDLERFMQVHHHHHQTFRQRFAGQASLEIYYEDLAAERDRELRRVTEFLEVQPAPTTSNLHKQGEKELRLAIKNYDALKKHYADTPWRGFFS